MPSIGPTITQAQLHDNPYPIFQKLLAHEPVSWVPAFDLWMVTRHADVIDILKDAETFTMEPATERANPMEDILGPMMLSIDGAEHKRIRDVFIEPFRPRHVRKWYARIVGEIAQRLVEVLLPSQSADLDKEFSDKLAIYTVVTTIGFEVDDVRHFRDLYDDLGAAIGNTLGDGAIRQRGKSAFEEFRALVLAQIELLRHTPNQSVLSQIVHSPVGALSVDEIVSNIALTFFGGVETASALLSNAIWALLSHPEQFEEVLREPSLLHAAIEESLRWESPVQAAMRFPTRDVVIEGVSIKQGEKIYCMLGAANRDPSVFQDPDLFDLHRANANQHLSFAYGPHFCFGAPLARMEATIGLPILFDQLRNLQLDPAHPTKPIGHEFRAPPTLFCCWG